MILVIRLLLFIVVLFASDRIFGYLLFNFRQGWLIKYVLSLDESFLTNKIKITYIYLTLCSNSSTCYSYYLYLFSNITVMTYYFQ